MKTIVLVSGGMDSAVLVHYLRKEGHIVKALGFDYGQRHAKELKFAARLMKSLLVPFEIVNLREVFGAIAGKNALTNLAVKVPDGHYAEESMKATVVPNRNMIMLSIAIGHAVALEFDAVAYGAHAGDHDIYPDCREPFAAAISDAARLCDWRVIEMMRPFVKMTKAEIAKLGAELHVPFEMTWSCYKGGSKHCGMCGICTERIEAFELAGLEDPTEYET